MVFGIFNSEKVAASRHREIHDFEQTKKMSPLITCEITFSQHVREFLVSTYLIWILGSKLTLSNNQPNTTVSSGHVSHRRTSALYDHFDHSFIILEHFQLSRLVFVTK